MRLGQFELGTGQTALDKTEDLSARDQGFANGVEPRIAFRARKIRQQPLAVTDNVVGSAEEIVTNGRLALPVASHTVVWVTHGNRGTHKTALSPARLSIASNAALSIAFTYASSGATVPARTS